MERQGFFQLRENFDSALYYFDQTIMRFPNDYEGYSGKGFLLAVYMNKQEKALMRYQVKDMEERGILNL